MSDPTSLADPENWSGGFYELEIELGERSDERLQVALSALSLAAGIEGCYGPTQGEQVPCTVAALTERGQLRGTVQLPNGRRIVCGRLSYGSGDRSDWLSFYLPLCALGLVEPRIGGFPFGDRSGPESLAWRRPLDDWLAAVAAEVFRAVPFRLGLIGFEVAGGTDAASLGGVVPPARWASYLLPDVSGQLRYAPANR